MTSMNVARTAFLDGILLSPANAPVTSRLPPFLYGCAWKRERTSSLVYQALSSGFRGIDVAAQPRHYREDLAGDGLRQALADGKIKRGELFVQTKYTPISGQDPDNIPYDAKSTITEQVQQSLTSSLHNLRVSNEAAAAEGTYLDSLVLHSPLPTIDLTLEAWRALESYVPNSIKYLGISNVSLSILRALYTEARVKPKFVQNRFYGDTLYDKELRTFCRENNIVFQAFWALTGNPRLVKAAPVQFLANATGVEPAAALYAFVLALDGNISIMNGTTTHMESDLESLINIKEWAQKDENSYELENQLKLFKGLVRENTSSYTENARDEAYSTSKRKPMRGEVDDPQRT